MRFSFSNLELYKKCKLAWKRRYIDKLEPTIKINSHLEKGSKVHLILEHYEYFINLTEDSDLVKKWKEQFNFKNLDTILKSPEAEIVRTFAKSELGINILSKKSKREETIMFNSEIEPYFGDTETCKFIGFIDRINVSEHLELIDYKTGKYKDQQYQHYDQLIIYALYMFLRYKHLNYIKIRFVYVEHLKENALELDRKMINYWKNYLKEMINTIENSNNFEPNFQPLCPWCEYVLMCKPELLKKRKDFNDILKLLSSEIINKYHLNH